MANSILIHNPRAPVSQGSGLKASVLDHLAGKVVGFIDNTKPNFNHLMDDLAVTLLEDYQVRSVIKRGKRVQSIPAPSAVVDELVAECDLVITGSGD